MANNSPAAIVCPKNPEHQHVRVYRTIKTIRGPLHRCKCNTCGETWEMTGELPADVAPPKGSPLKPSERSRKAGRFLG